MLKAYLSRIAKLFWGQVISGVGVTLMLQANIGTDPWNVLHQGLSRVTGLTVGLVSIIVGIGIIVIALALGQRIGLGTIIGVIVPGIVIDILISTGLAPLQTTFWGGLLMLVSGLELLTIGTWLYMKQCLGTGPRDALNVAFARRTRFSVGACRSSIELLATLAGWMLGGQVGAGTIISAFGIGILFQLNFKLLHFDAAGLEQENLLQTWRRIKG